MRQLLVVLATVLMAPAALADETVTTKPAVNHVQIMHDYIIYGRRMQPIAVQDVGKLPMQSTLADLKQPLVQRIEPTVQNSPF
jgi:hypothetical protein